MKKLPPHPMQPIYKADDGVVRFRANRILARLQEIGVIDLNKISINMSNPTEVEDAEQFWQLLGYSVSGYGDLSFIRPETVEEADRQADNLLEAKP